MHEALGSNPQHYKRTKQKLQRKKRFVYKGDITPKDSGWKPATIYAIAIVPVGYCVSLKSSVTVFFLMN